MGWIAQVCDWVDELVEAGGISFQLLGWTHVPGLHCSVMAFLSWCLCDAECLFSLWFMPHCWGDLVSITLETCISADSKPCQNHQACASILNVMVRVEDVSRESSGQQFTMIWTEIHSSWWDAQWDEYPLHEWGEPSVSFMEMKTQMSSCLASWIKKSFFLCLFLLPICN